MSFNPIKLTSLSSAALLYGALAPAAWAQDTRPAIVPIDGTTPAKAPVPSPVAPPLPTAAARPLVEVSFKDVEVADLLDIISRQFDVQVVISGDVSGRLASINLSNKTPEAAIQAVVRAANLTYQRLEDGTFLIGKNLPDMSATQGGGMTPVAPGATDRSGLPTAFGGSVAPLGALPQFGGGASSFEVPPLIGENQSTAQKRTYPLIIKNLAPSILAYWLDPANNDMPIQLQASEKRNARYGQTSAARNALNAVDQSLINGMGGMTGNSFANSNMGINPYTQQNGMEFRSNAQFGGGGNNNNNGGGGRGGNNGGGRGGNNGRGGAGGGVFQLPDGVDRIVAVDPQNALLVFGTAEGVRELQDTIAILDRPLRQVEIEAQFVTVSTADSRNFGIDFSTAQGNFNASNTGFASPASQGSFQVGFVRGNFQATLNALLTKNRAKLITAPRVTAINNLTASLFSTTQRPLILTTAVQGGGLNGGQAQGQNLIYIQSNTGLTVTPTINNDDTITVLMQPQVEQQTLLADIQAPLLTTQQLETIANVRDGDTIALGGLKTRDVSRGGSKIPLLGDLPFGIGKLFRSRSATDNESELIIFLTARIVRRLEEDDAVPGT